MNAVLLNFLLIKESWKKSIKGSKKNKQLFPTLIINQHFRVISEDHVTLKTEVMMLKLSFANIEINYILNVY